MYLSFIYILHLYLYVCIILDPGLSVGLPLYQRLIDLAGYDSIILVPDSPLTKHSVSVCFQKLAETNYVSFQGYLKCGYLGSRILLSPPPMVICFLITLVKIKLLCFFCVLLFLTKIFNDI